MTITMASGGEFDRIRTFVAALGDRAGAIGDDTATIPDGDGTLVTSVDVSVDEVHFRREWLSAEEIGWRATAAALSDLAAAAATPSGVLLGLTLPRGTDDDTVRALARGVAGALRASECALLGGDLAGGGALSLAVTAFGRATRPMSRRGARVGDGVWVTGVLGGARAALAEWQEGREPATGARVAFARPQSRHRAARWLADQGATAMMDVSDGLAGDVPHLAAASGVAIDIDLGAVPIHPSVHAVAARRGEAAARFAAVGGEDYELLLTLPAGVDVAGLAEPATGVTVRRIGTVCAGRGVRFLAGGEVVALEGYRHAT